MKEYFRDFVEIARQEARRGWFETMKNRKKSLTQTELAEAYQAEIKVRREADMLLDNQDQILRIDAKGRGLRIKGKTQLQKEGRSSSGADLEIFIFESKEAGDNYYQWDTSYAFYRNSVNVCIGKAKGRKGQATEPDLITRQANAKDLTVLLKVLIGSKPI